MLFLDTLRERGEIFIRQTEKQVPHMGWLGLRLDQNANAAGRAVVSTPDSPVRAPVANTYEEAMIAEQTFRVALLRK